MNKILVLFLAFTFTTANAGLLIEPYLGYGITGLESDNGGSGSSVELGIQGQSLGFRGGLTFLGAFAALDYEMGSRSLDIDAGSTTVSVLDKDVTNVALAVGYDVPVIPIRVWGKYIIKSEYKDSSETWKGGGMGVGLGLTFLPIIDINIEYKKIEFDEGLPAGADDFTGQEIFLSLSAPFTL